MNRIKVLIVDDSAFARKVIREVLQARPEIEVVGYARDGLDAVEKIAALNPDVITLDLLMPDLDGLGVLAALPAETRGRVLIVSVSQGDSDLAVQALQMGAFDIVTKPTVLATDRLYDLSEELVAKVQLVARTKRLSVEPALRAPALSGPQASALRAPTLLVIGTSTGGPQALTQLFRELPAGINFPIGIALHIPPGYTASLSARISLHSPVPMKEASHGELLLPGHAYIAPGGKHLAIDGEAGKFYARVGLEPLNTIHHPSVDVLFSSAAAAAGAGALGIVLTGMGNDGLAGAKDIHDRGGRILAEAES
ncbi:MAG: chemotaxis-specific protein-glutamate methyltransferase CheB, partial [Proteobacteria bacterium]